MCSSQALCHKALARFCPLPTLSHPARRAPRTPARLEPAWWGRHPAAPAGQGGRWCLAPRLLLALAPALPPLLRRLLMLALHCRQPPAAEAPRRPHVPTHGSPGRHQEQESRPPPAAQAAKNFCAPTPRHGFPATRRGAPKRGQCCHRGAQQPPKHAAAPGSASRGHRAGPVALGSLLKAEITRCARTASALAFTCCKSVIGAYANGLIYIV